MYDIWDRDDDGVIDEGEFSTGLFGVYDVNSDGNITEEEWDGSYDPDLNWFRFNTNADSFIGPDEFKHGIFVHFDLDNDGVWDGRDWGKVGLYDVN